MSLIRESDWLGEALYAQGLLNLDQKRILQIEASRRQIPVAQLAVSLGFTSEQALHHLIGKIRQQVLIDLDESSLDIETAKKIPEAIARQYRVVPIIQSPAESEGRLVIASPDPDHLVMHDRIEKYLGHQVAIDYHLATEPQVQRALDRLYGSRLSIDHFLQKLEAKGTPTQEDDSSPIVGLLDALLDDAIRQDASDIHLEPEIAHLRIRYRIDGLLHTIRLIHKDLWQALAVRLKLLAQMDIAESRRPQDGRFSLVRQGQGIDFRTSMLPTQHGEACVLRILNRQLRLRSLVQLGVPATQRQHLRQLIQQPEGLILVTGPTGSGKTTTLYSMIQQLDTLSTNVITLEDPIEYPLPNIRQTSVGENQIMDFAEGVKTILRQDPDVILIGEIRDTETAEMALRAAMTGHLVLATLHTQNALGAIPRLLSMGIAPDILAGNLLAVISQRLVRRLCEHCRSPYSPLPINNHLKTPLHAAQGCPQCGFRGYRGRMALMEILEISEAMQHAISEAKPLSQLQGQSLAQGFQTLNEAATQCLERGESSWDEINRVVRLRPVASSLHP